MLGYAKRVRNGPVDRKHVSGTLRSALGFIFAGSTAWSSEQSTGTRARFPVIGNLIFADERAMFRGWRVYPSTVRGAAPRGFTLRLPSRVLVSLLVAILPRPSQSASILQQARHEGSTSESAETTVPPTQQGDMATVSAVFSVVGTVPPRKSCAPETG